MTTTHGPNAMSKFNEVELLNIAEGVIADASGKRPGGASTQGEECASQLKNAIGDDRYTGNSEGSCFGVVSSTDRLAGIKNRFSEYDLAYARSVRLVNEAKVGTDVRSEKKICADIISGFAGERLPGGDGNRMLSDMLMRAMETHSRYDRHNDYFLEALAKRASDVARGLNREQKLVLVERMINRMAENDPDKDFNYMLFMDAFSAIAALGQGFEGIVRNACRGLELKVRKVINRLNESNEGMSKKLSDAYAKISGIKITTHASSPLDYAFGGDHLQGDYLFSIGVIKLTDIQPE